MHHRREQQSLEMHRRIAGRLRDDPNAVLAKAFANLDSWLQRQAGGASEAVLVEWRKLLETSSIAEIAAFLGSEEERAVRMRQSSPFAGVLAPQEVWEIKKHYATARA
ncbi:MAG: hypothetical protein MUF04_11435 [Akkermansiaceae bacterium]|jgi:hypothetical protein|nr:hypothetical protein [Akkermansiaceae bacterium]